MRSESTIRRLKASTLGVSALLLLLLALLFRVALERNTAPVDWLSTYYPATRALIECDSPYVKAPLFFAPVWSLIPLIPFGLLPADVGGALFFVTSLVGFAYLGFKAGCKPIGIVALILSAPVANCIQTGNIEWIPLLGAYLPAPINLILLSMKPQSTIGLIALVIFIANQEGGLQKVIKNILPVLILFAFSCLAYGLWFLKIGGAYQAAGNFLVSVWPYGIPVGLGLLIYAFRMKRFNLAMAASPFLSPYAILLTWSGFVVSFAKSDRLMIVVSIASWVLWFAFRAYIGV